MSGAAFGPALFEQLFRPCGHLPDQRLQRIEAVDAEIPFQPGSELLYPPRKSRVARNEPCPDRDAPPPPRWWPRAVN
jgi:hypothetical protein